MTIMEYFSCLWKKISRIVIVVIALFCVGSIMPEEVKAYEGVDLRYKEEGKHNLYDSKSYTHNGYLRVYFDETQGYEPGVYLYLSFYDWTVKSNYSFSVYMEMHYYYRECVQIIWKIQKDGHINISLFHYNILKN